MTMPRPVRLFHITALDNLTMICQQGELTSKTKGASLGIQYHNIAHTGAQSTRAQKSVINPPGGSVHEFVPFYFAPRSPMLSAIHHGRVTGCHYAQTDIIHFELTIETALRQGLKDFVFYDRNATKAYSQAYTDLTLLHSVIDWQTLTEAPTLDGFCKYFMDVHDNPRYVDRMEKRQAEFLIKKQVPISWITRIGVANEIKAQQVHAILQQNKINLPVVIMKNWYF
ncbi:type II toxin-antitoxin system toxin DNA ADP-ribosyl transferase DarT [Shewanella frigidimarina]|uniref:type II toxin-antitoxin system toxin DNA ADP-ribosyl transferase DarT n=1 Tax=Shewanella frigidimarina TaxID=56812 RepID=UPI003FA00414